MPRDPRDGQGAAAQVRRSCPCDRGVTNPLTLLAPGSHPEPQHKGNTTGDARGAAPGLLEPVPTDSFFLVPEEILPGSSWVCGSHGQSSLLLPQTIPKASDKMFICSFVCGFFWFCFVSCV